MLIDCYQCEAKVDAKIIAFHDSIDELFAVDGEILTVNHRSYLLECAVCKETLLAGHYLDGDDPLTDPSRLWPPPEKHIEMDIPKSVRISLEEARKSFKAKAYLACAVMCGRVLEGICMEYATKDKSLAGGLKELLDNGIIDKRIFEWGEALRKHRNIAAHVGQETINKDDARDLLDFANAICEYIFVLSKKFEKFMSRKEHTEKNKGKL